MSFLPGLCPQCAQRDGGGGGAILDAELAVDLFEMLVHGARALLKDIGNILVGLAPRQPAQNFGLAAGQRQFLMQDKTVVPISEPHERRAVDGRARGCR